MDDPFISKQKSMIRAAYMLASVFLCGAIIELFRAGVLLNADQKQEAWKPMSFVPYFLIFSLGAFLAGKFFRREIAQRMKAKSAFVETEKPPPPDGSITIEYKLEMRDYRECRRMLASPTWPPRRSRSRLMASPLLGWAFVLGCVALLIWLNGGIGNVMDILRSNPAVTAAVATFAVILFALWLYIIFLIRRSLGNAGGTVTFGTSGVDFIGKDTAAHHNWPKFSGWAESDDLVVLVLSGDATKKREGFYFPKRLFSSVGDLNKLRQLLASQFDSPQV